MVALFSTCCCVNLWIHLCSVCKFLVNILTQDVWLGMNGCYFLHLLLCKRALTCPQEASYFHLWLTLKNEWLFVSPLAVVWTWTLTCVQPVSYFHIWYSNKKCVIKWIVTLFSTCCCVNLCSVGKLLFFSFWTNELTCCMYSQVTRNMTPMCIKWICD